MDRRRKKKRWTAKVVLLSVNGGSGMERKELFDEGFKSPTAQHGSS